MFRWALASWAVLAPLAAQPVTVALPDGEISIQWLSPSTFRYCRAWSPQTCASPKDATADEVKVTAADSPGQLRLATEFLVLVIQKSDGRLEVLNVRGKTLLAEPSPALRAEGAITVARNLAPDEALFGLGTRDAASADARGSAVESSQPLLVSSAGYGLFHPDRARYSFDLGAAQADQWRLTVRGAERLDYYFYFGPGYKGVLDEHLLVAQPSGYASLGILTRRELPARAQVIDSPPNVTWETLAQAMRKLVHASLSGIPQPAFDLSPYRAAGDTLYRRAAQLASVAPLVVDAPGLPEESAKAAARTDLAEWRRRLTPFLLAYVQEIGDHGYPMLHPLALQYPNDAEGRKLADQFLLGDELLVAPIYTENGRRTVYFPMGNWTDLGTNQVYPGRRTAEIEAPPDTLPLFLRNGAILPMENEKPDGPMVLHYTPTLAAEFFLFEPQAGEYSQLHASPSLDRMRLEIDSKAARSYEWVVHHLPAVREVRLEETPCMTVKDRAALTPGTWFYDTARRDLHVMVAAQPGQTRVAHVTFQ